MDKRDQIKEDLTLQGLLPLYFHADLQTSIDTMRALYNAGIRLIEYTNRGEQAQSNFREMKTIADRELPGLYLGIGTIKDENTAQQYIDAGADFLVSPALAEDVYDIAYSNKILWIPGCMTPTEILKAEQFGLTLVKLFPGNILGPAFVQGVLELFPAMKFMPTGGVDTTKENLSAWFSAGVSAVGMGSKLISKERLSDKDYTGIESETKKVLELIKQVRS